MTGGPPAKGGERAGAPLRTLVENRNYVRLFSAQLTSLIGSGVTSVALAAFAYQLAGRKATSCGPDRERPI